MLNRLRSTWMAGGGGILLVLALSGVVAGATLVSAITAPASDPTSPPPTAGTTQTFVDANGNGIDDKCETNVVADPSAAASAQAAVDLNGDGTISVSEAAQSGRIGGKNCNHGGYVSSVARGSDACSGGQTTADTETSGDPSAGDEDESSDAPSTAPSGTTTSDAAICAVAPSDTPDTTDTSAPPVCPPVVATTDGTTTTDGTASTDGTAAPTAAVAPNDHGKKVSEVAKSTAVGGKNCNHGGAVSAAAKDHTSRDASKAARDALKALRQHGKHHGG